MKRMAWEEKKNLGQIGKWGAQEINVLLISYNGGKSACQQFVALWGDYGKIANDGLQDLN